MPTRIHKAARRLTSRLGVHGAGLLFIAAVWWIIGIRLLIHPAPAPDGVWHAYIPTPISLAMWWGASLLCLGAAIDRHGPRRDGFALGFATIPPALAVCSYIWSWIISLIPSEPHGYPLGWYTASLYLALVGLVVLVTAIPDPDPDQPEGAR
jgi:hypothetical protein